MKIDFVSFTERHYANTLILTTPYVCFELFSDRKEGIEKIGYYLPTQTVRSGTRKFSIYETTVPNFDELRQWCVSQSSISAKYNFYIDSYMVALDMPGIEGQIFMEENNTDYFIYRALDKICVLTSDKGYDQNLLLRFVREIYYREGIGQGALFFHAGGVAVQDKGILIIGPSGTGKTTFLTKACESAGVDFITNDRISIDRAGHLNSFPMQIRIGIGNFNNLKLYHMYLKQPNRFKRLNNTSSEITKAEFKFEVEPSLFCELNGIGHVASAPLGYIVLPTLRLGMGSSFEIEVLSQKEAIRIMENEFTNLNDYVWPEPWLIRPAIEESYTEQMEGIYLKFLFLNVIFGFEADFEKIIKNILDHGKTD
ncbi:hypothetical protein HUK80_06130 [Flavobacterium sp. MAH-1]|uniref:Uncharacterized protein n=1 Tax=Flavobacterium agri TaxID=2743471 RepID=A0A7Y8Y168_9FLAO|nr:hypothetical protein [Flavobacterium agri]NUY80467.1 hypothetical protein [Flavobacterium agri]NYA70492.1 hypothetical protein [Flavobacterium agri]